MLKTKKNVCKCCFQWISNYRSRYFEEDFYNTSALDIWYTVYIQKWSLFEEWFKNRTKELIIYHRFTGQLIQPEYFSIFVWQGFIQVFMARHFTSGNLPEIRHLERIIGYKLGALALQRFPNWHL